MEKYELQKLRDLPIEEVAERLGLQVTRHKCLCPFHNDSHPSLSFHRGRNTYRCFVCGAHGGTIDLVMKYLNKDFLDACRWLGAEPEASSFPSKGGMTYRHLASCSPPSTGAGEAPVEAFDARRYERFFEHPFNAQRYERFFEHPFLSQEARRFLFDERRLDPRVVRWCRLTSWRDKQGTPWLQIPYYSRQGQLIGVQNRNLASPNTSKGEKAPRFRFPQGAECSIYNLPVLNRLNPGDTLFITEGASDCWAMLSAGHKAIAIPSATLLKPKDAHQLAALQRQASIRFAMYPDNDAPGERLFLQLKEVLPTLVHHQLPPGCKDFGDYYKLRV